jgi:hypothetical protein
MRLEILPLIGLQLVESSNTGLHRLRAERFISHGDPPSARSYCLRMIFSENR